MISLLLQAAPTWSGPAGTWSCCRSAGSGGRMGYVRRGDAGGDADWMKVEPR